MYRKIAPANVSAEEFVVAFTRAKSIAEVAGMLKMTAEQVRSRAARYRKMGVALKKYPRGWAGRPVHFTPEYLARLNNLVAHAADPAPEPAK